MVLRSQHEDGNPFMAILMLINLLKKSQNRQLLQLVRSIFSRNSEVNNKPICWVQNEATEICAILLCLMECI